MNHFTGWISLLYLPEQILVDFLCGFFFVISPIDVCFSNHQNSWLSLLCTILMTHELISLLQTSPINTTCGSYQKYFFLQSSISTSNPTHQKLNSSPFALCIVFLKSLFYQKIIIARTYLLKTKEPRKLHSSSIFSHYLLPYIISDNAL